MSREDIEAYLHAHIPLSTAMGLRVLVADDEQIVIEAPLEANLNHRGTAFGGSVAALAIVTGWTAVHSRLRREGFDSHCVIHESSVRYDAPIDGSFRAVADRLDDDHWARFIKALTRHHKARMRVDVRIEADGVDAAVFKGSYVAFAGEDDVANASSAAASMSCPPG